MPPYSLDTRVPHFHDDNLESQENTSTYLVLSDQSGLDPKPEKDAASMTEIVPEKTLHEILPKEKELLICFSAMLAYIIIRLARSYHSDTERRFAN